jgi:hypothetical protein
MRSILVLSLIGLAGCSSTGRDWRAKAVNNAETLLRQQFNDPSLKFVHVQYTGDSSTGQTCGYFERPDPGAGMDDTRFISFIDGGGGQNPYIDDPSAPYPKSSSDFELNWQTQCLDLGYHQQPAQLGDETSSKY